MLPVVFSPFASLLMRLAGRAHRDQGTSGRSSLQMAKLALFNVFSVTSYADVQEHFGQDVAERLVRKFELILTSNPTKTALWQLAGPLHIGVVFSDGYSKEKQASPLLDKRLEVGSQWWPCVAGLGHGSDTEVVPVICEPLLDMRCKKPWQTHCSRLLLWKTSWAPGQQPWQLTGPVSRLMPKTCLVIEDAKSSDTMQIQDVQTKDDTIQIQDVQTKDLLEDVQTDEPVRSFRRWFRIQADVWKNWRRLTEDELVEFEKEMSQM